jgi:ABC-type phosphate/phosphonate transport system substrate-binding protein
LLESLDEKGIHLVEKLFSSKLVDFHFITPNPASGDSGIVKAPRRVNVKFNAGILDATKLAELNKVQEKHNILFTTSPASETECTREVQIVSNGDVKKITDLNQKIFGISDEAMPLSYLTIKQLKGKGISAKEIHTYRVLEAGVKDLLEKKIDVLITRVSVLSDKKILTKVGIESNHSFPNNPSLNVIFTSEDKIPCTLIYVSKSVPEKVQSELFLNLKSAFSTLENENNISKVTMLKSIHEISPEEWKKVKAQIGIALDFQLKTFSPLIYNHY